MPDIPPSVRERVLEGWTTYLAAELSTVIDRNRRAPVSLGPEEEKIILVDGDEEPFEADEAMNIVARVMQFHVEIYLTGALASIGPRLNDIAARIELAVYRNRGLRLSDDEPELCHPAGTSLLTLNPDLWREKNTEPGGSVGLTFQCVYAHAWDDPYELC